MEFTASEFFSEIFFMMTAISEGVVERIYKEQLNTISKNIDFKGMNGLAAL